MPLACLLALVSQSFGMPADGSAELARRVATEGMVLLENNGALPIEAGTHVAVFGIGQIQYWKVGTGSGSVTSDYEVNLLEGLRNNPDIVVDEELAAVYESYYAAQQEAARSGGAPGPGGGGGPGMPSAVVGEISLEDGLVAAAAERAPLAIVTFARLSGEGRDRALTKGDYYLSDAEAAMLGTVRAAFDRVVVVLNITGVIDMNWVDTFQPDAVLVAWLAGLEGGNAMADILSGAVSPSGKLPDTISVDYLDHPSSHNFGGFVDGYETVVADGNETEYWGMIPNHKTPPRGTSYRRPVGNRYFVEYEEGIYVGYRYFETFGKAVKYPFGYGLSYTTFELTNTRVAVRGGQVTVSTTVTNTGDVAGKEVVQVYYGAPQGKLERPAKELAGYAKTDTLEPGQGQAVTVIFAADHMAGYDEGRAAYVLEPGSYAVYVGNSVRNAELAGRFAMAEERLVAQLTNQLGLAPGTSMTLLSQQDPDGTFPEPPPLRSEQDASAVPGPGAGSSLTFAARVEEEARIKLKDVYDGGASMPEFLAQLSDAELVNLIVGNGRDYRGGIFGEASPGPADDPTSINLDRLGIPATSLSDGPAGMGRGKDGGTTAFPVATLVASTWNEDLAEELGAAFGREALVNDVDIWLAPGLNIHRNPLCGRNYEYYSEDPLLSGTMAAGVTRGVQSNGVAVSLKHFVANNQEANRFDGIDTVVPERALREIYLKGFEIAVKTGDPWSLMTSYNGLNGKFTTAAWQGLTDDILRGEWGFDGYVVTDWEGDGLYTVEAIKARHDLVMPGFVGQAFYVLARLQDGSLTREDLDRSAATYLAVVMKTPAFAKYYGITDGSNGAYEAPRRWTTVQRSTPVRSGSANSLDNLALE